MPAVSPPDVGGHVIYRFGPFSMDLDRFEVRHGADKVELSPKAFEVLRALLENPERTLTKHELLDTVWPGVAVTEAVLTQAVHTARRALEADVIQTVSGRGYRIGVPVELDDGAVSAERPLSSPLQAADRPTPRSRPILMGTSVTALTLVAALVWLGRAPDVAQTPVGRSLVRAFASPQAIAVLPFADMSPGGAQQHVADGVTEEIINALAGLPELRVAARTSAFVFKERLEDVRTIATELGVEAVLEGSVRISGPRIRIAAQLIEAESGFHLWSEVYEREVEDLFAVQQEIADAIRTELRVQLVESRHAGLAGPPPQSFEAYQLYLRARAAYYLRTKAGFEEALSLFEQSLAIDPDFAPAWAGISDVHRSVYGSWLPEPRDGPMLAAAEFAARKAIELSPESAEGHNALANLYNVRHRDWPQAEDEYLEAIRL